MWKHLIQCVYVLVLCISACQVFRSSSSWGFICYLYSLSWMKHEIITTSYFIIYYFLKWENVKFLQKDKVSKLYTQDFLILWVLCTTILSSVEVLYIRVYKHSNLCLDSMLRKYIIKRQGRPLCYFSTFIVLFSSDLIQTWYISHVFVFLTH